MASLSGSILGEQRSVRFCVPKRTVSRGSGILYLGWGKI
jgi:hypothetical protein